MAVHLARRRRRCDGASSATWCSRRSPSASACSSTRELLHGVARLDWDVDVTTWLVERRTPTPQRPLAGRLLLRRHGHRGRDPRRWCSLVLASGDATGASRASSSVAIAVEAATYLTATFFVERHRPWCPASRTSSSPTATSPATSRPRSRCTGRSRSSCGRSPATAGARGVVLVLAVARAARSSRSSRMYRGMHYASDVIVGALVGLGCLVVAVLAVRAGGVHADAASTTRRRARPRPSPIRRVASMTSVAVVAHRGKTLGGGLTELRAVLARARRRPTRCGSRCRRASRRRSACGAALDAGADLIFVWGGDGMVQRCIDAVGGTSRSTLAILPAGHREPARHQPRDPDRPRGGGRGRAARRRRADRHAAARRRALRGDGRRRARRAR